MKAENPQHYLVQSNDVFTDRIRPRSAFWNIYDRLGADDIEILNFYGVGGIGKTSLLEQLQKELAEKGLSKYVYCSFEDGKSRDMFLFQLSEELIKKNRKLRFPIFYYAFEKYRMLVGESVIGKQMVENASLLDHHLVGSALEVAADYVPYLKTFSSVVTEGSKALAQLSKKHEQVRGINSRLYEEISAFDNAKDLLNKLHLYFAVDAYNYFANVQDAEPLVIMLDGYEVLVNRMKKGDKAIGDDYWLRERGSLIMSIPHTLWVIAGREKLGWGQDMLPEKQAIALDNLGEEDALSYFDAVGVRDKVLAKKMYELTSGSPIFMDLCARQYKQALEKHPFDRPTIEDIGADTDQIANNYLRDMGKSEQSIMYLLACMPKNWDDALVEAAAEAAQSAINPQDYKLLKESSFVKMVDPQKQIYTLHEAFRTIVVAKVKEDDKRLYANVIKDILMERVYTIEYSERVDSVFENLADVIRTHYEYLNLSLEDIKRFSLVAGVYWAHTGNGLEALTFLEEKLVDSENEERVDKCLYLWNAKLFIVEEQGVDVALQLAEKVFAYIQNEPLYDDDNAIRFYCDYSRLLYEMDRFGESAGVLRSVIMFMDELDTDVSLYSKEIVARQYGKMMTDYFENTEEATKVYMAFLSDLEEEKNRVKEMEDVDFGEAIYDHYFATQVNILSECELHEEAIAAQEELIERMKNRNEAVDVIEKAECDLAYEYYYADDIDSAIDILTKLDETIQSRHDSQTNTYPIYSLLSNCYLEMQSFANAEKYALLARKILVQTQGEGSQLVAGRDAMIGRMYEDFAVYEKAEEYFEKARTKLENIYGSMHSRVMDVKQQEAEMYYAWGKYEKSDALWRELCANYNELYGEDHSQFLYASFMVGETKLRSGNDRAAYEIWRNIYPQISAKADENPNLSLEINLGLAIASADVGDRELAASCADAFTEIVSTLSKDERLNIASAFSACSTVYKWLGDKDGEKMMLEEAYMLTDEVPDLYGEDYWEICYELGCLYRDEGDIGRAFNFLLEAYAHYEEVGDDVKAAEIRSMIEEIQRG